MLTLSRLHEGERVEIERMLSFNVIDLITLPWRAKYAGQQTELAKLRAAQDVIRVAADTRKARFSALAAEQTARYLQDATEAAQAGAELARRMARVGNWSKLQQAREQATLANLATQLAHAQQLPDNTLPMMGGQGPFGPAEMGGMFTVLKVRQAQPAGDYRDPGWFRHPAGSVAYEFSGELPAPARAAPAPAQAPVELKVRKPSGHSGHH